MFNERLCGYTIIIYVAVVDISYEYHELRPIEGKEEEEEDEATLELTLECDDLDPPPTKKLATEAEIIEGR